MSYDWFKLEGLAERGAGGRLIIAPGVLTRADLDFNWDVVAVAMEYMGARPGVDQLQPEVDLFFQRSPAEGQETGRFATRLQYFRRLSGCIYVLHERYLAKVNSAASKPGEFGI